MGGYNKYGAVGQLISGLSRVRTRTWVVLGGIALVLLGLMAWAAIALLSWLWSQTPQVAETGRQWAGEAVTQIEEVAPGLKDEVVKWLPGQGEPLPTRDVSGKDLGPVARFPGLVRSRYERGEQVIEVRYAGRAEFDAVLRHYADGFGAAGFTQEVLAASLEEERHRFVKADETFELTFWRRPDGVIELAVKQILQ